MNKPDAHSWVNRVDWRPERDKPGEQRHFDQMVVRDVAKVHIERMDDGTFWLAIYKHGEGGERQAVTFTSSGPLHAVTEADA